MAGSTQLKCTVSATLLPLLVILTICSGHTIRYVKPTPNTPCPADPCLTLSEYAQQPRHYLTSNTMLLLLPGDHTLSVNFTVENVSEFEISAAQLSSQAENQPVKIVCQGLVGFTFRNISHMTLHDLTFTSCSKGATNAVSIHSGQDTKIVNCSFQDSICTALGVFNSSLVLRRSSSFINNCAKYSGSSCFCLGGGIYAETSTLVFTGNSTFRDNSAYQGGGLFTGSCTINFTGSSTFMGNSANFGGGFNAGNTTFNFKGRSTFMNNSARSSGGGFYIQASTVRVSTTRITGTYGGSCNSDKLVFMNNLASFHGGAIYTQDSNLYFEGCNIFSGNSAHYYGGGVYSSNSTLKFNGNTSFKSNSGRLQGGGIYGLGTSVHFSGNSSFTANTAARGGGEYLTHSPNFFSRHANIIFEKNNATRYGGAVYVEDSDPISYCFPDYDNNPVNCFFQIDDFSGMISFFRAFLDIHVRFYQNYARTAGSSLHGGAIFNCTTYAYHSGTKYGSSTSIPPLYLELEPTNSISSDPFQVFLCEDGTPTDSELVRRVYPGELLHFPLVASGQGKKTIPAVIKAFFNDTYGNTSLARFQDTQKVTKTCTELYYQVHSSTANHNETLVLYADGLCSTDGRLLNISLQFLPCPPGFSLNSSERICGCEPRLQKYTTRCNVTKREIKREKEYWVGYDNSSQALILHPHCPFDYCKPVTDQTSFPLNNTDLQCANSRSGLLCGRCKPGLSLALGSSKCIQCSDLYIWLVIPFALAGIALVLLLLALKLTVAAGTTNGLLFYANIVTVNRSIFFPPNQTNILTVFIAWLNLDLGIETCLFDGLDAYVKTWLQYIFPLYIWSLVGLIIIVSDYSSTIAKLFGSNPVAVLATLFLLSYAKLLRTIIAALFFTLLDYPNEVQVAVWLHDGNIRYLHGKHIVLFLVASLTLLLLFLPYTLLLTVGQWLQALSNHRLFYWINKPRIKPFLDAYQAPYKDQHRYWTGLMLCLRSTLFFVFAFNTQADPSLNLLAIGAVVIGLLTLTHFTGLMYKKMYLDILEISFILNLGILAIATYYVKLAVVQVSQAAVTYTSVSVALTTFVGVLLYHTYQQVWPKLQQRLQQLRHQEESESFKDSISEEETRPLLAPTTTIIEFPDEQKPITIDTADDCPVKAPPLKTVAFTELREPLDLIDTNDP